VISSFYHGAYVSTQLLLTPTPLGERDFSAIDTFDPKNEELVACWFG
jgi:hypothetical protein